MAKYHDNTHLKHCLQNGLLFFIGLMLFITPTYAYDATIDWDGSSDSTGTLAGLTGSYVPYTPPNNILRFDNLQTLNSFSYVSILDGTVGSIYPSTGEIDFDVSLWNGANLVGYATFGYAKLGDGSYQTWLYRDFERDWDISSASSTPVYLTIKDVNFVIGHKTEIASWGSHPFSETSAIICTTNPRPIGGEGTTFKTYLYYEYFTSYSYWTTINSYNFELYNMESNGTKTIIEIVGNEYINETTFNENTLSYSSADLGNYTWNITVENVYGDIENLQIDFSQVPPGPQAENTILWGADNYYVDDTGSYSWVLSDTNWGTFLYSKKASIYRDGTMVSEVTLPTQTGTFYYNFDKEGNYDVKLRKTSFILPHVTIYTDSVNVVLLPPSYITVKNIPLYTNTPIEFEYSFGFDAEIHYNTAIKVMQLVGSNWFLLQTYSLIDELPNTPNVISEYSTINSTRQIQAEGDYKFILTDYIRGDVAETGVYHVTYRAGTLTHNITTSDISLQSMIAHVAAPTTYQSRDSIYWSYKIDNVNYTNGLVYFEVYSVDQDITTMSALLSEQVASRLGTIYTTGVTPNYYAIPAVVVGMVGENQFRLVHENSSGRTILDYCTFNLTSVSYTGYGLELNKYSVNVNEDVTAVVTIPSASYLVIKNPQNSIVANYSLNASTVITRRYPITGTYTYLLIPAGSNTAEATASLQVGEEIAGPGVDTPEYQDSWGMAENMFNFMSLPAFWGLIIIIGFIGSLAMKTNVNGNVLAFITFALVNLFVLFGLFDPYGFYIIVLTWILAGMMFSVGRRLVRGDE